MMLRIILCLARGGVRLLQYGIQKLNRGSSSATFSVNLTVEKTLLMQFCYYFWQKSPLLGL